MSLQVIWQYMDRSVTKKILYRPQHMTLSAMNYLLYLSYLNSCNPAFLNCIVFHVLLKLFFESVVSSCWDCSTVACFDLFSFTTTYPDNKKAIWGLMIDLTPSHYFVSVSIQAIFTLFHTDYCRFWSWSHFRSAVYEIWVTYIY